MNFLDRYSLHSRKLPAKRLRHFCLQLQVKGDRLMVSCKIGCRVYFKISNRYSTFYQSIQKKRANHFTNLQGEKALQNFISLDIQQQLSRHLLKTSGSELVNELVCYVAQDTVSANDAKDLSTDVGFFFLSFVCYSSNL